VPQPTEKRLFGCDARDIYDKATRQSECQPGICSLDHGSTASCTIDGGNTIPSFTFTASECETHLHGHLNLGTDFRCPQTAKGEHVLAKGYQTSDARPQFISGFCIASSRNMGFIQARVRGSLLMYSFPRPLHAGAFVVKTY
jgi:hypothetical protein